MAEPTQTSKAFGSPPEDRAKSGTAGLLRSFSFAQFQFSSIIIILAMSGLVPFEDVLCVLLATMYIYAMSKLVFPPVSSSSPPSVYKDSWILPIYVTVAAYVGLYLPLAFILLGVILGDKKAVQAAAPHTFLLACQVLSEQIAYTSSTISLPVRALVPILYNSGRIVSIWVWMQADFFKGAPDVSASSFPVSSGPVSAVHWVWFGRALVVANLVLWTYNLFGFLIPMYLPQCFRRYFEDEKAWIDQRKLRARSLHTLDVLLNEDLYYWG